MPSGATWMRDVPGSRWITELSIPGTHQSYLRNNVITIPVFKSFAACQYDAYDIPRQLEVGVRFFDFRMEFGARIKHGKATTRGNFFSEVQCCVDFLNRNRSECVLVSSKWENEPLLGDPVPEKDIEVQWIVNQLKEKFGSDRFWFQPETPRLDDVRGKIIFLSRWRYETIAKEGIRFDPSQEYRSDPPPTYRAQDRYDMTKEMKNNPCDMKWHESVYPLLRTAQDTAQTEPKTWFYNFLSAYAGVPYGDHLDPHDLAWGWGQYKGSGINDSLRKYYEGMPPGRLGIVIVDFVNEDLARVIWGSNFEQKDR